MDLQIDYKGYMRHDVGRASKYRKAREEILLMREEAAGLALPIR